MEQPPIVIALGRTLRKERQSQELSQDALAIRASVNPKHLSQLERGKHDPSVGIVDKLARGLDWSVGALMTAAEEELAMREKRGRRPN